MAVSRRGFLRISGAAAAGTALGGVAGLGLQPKRAQAAAQALRIQNAKAFPSVCPYCAVGCGTLVHVANGQIINIEGNPDSPVNQGNLCPKGAAIYQLHVNPNRQTKVLHRAPGAAQWEEMDLNTAMDRVAQLVKKTRDETFVVTDSSGKKVMATEQIFSLGGATMDNEWNHVQQKLLRGLGVTPIENQARI
jgi:formate dehydrogenase major subunit